MTSNIVKIGEHPDRSFIKMPTSKHCPGCFDREFKERLQELLLPGFLPLEDDPNMDLVEVFGVTYYEKQSPPRRHYYFFCTNYAERSKVMEMMFDKNGRQLISGPTLDAQSVLSAVRKYFPDEKWIADNVMELPLKSKINNEYIQSIVSKCFDVENERFYKYLHLLQQNYKREHM